MFYFLFILILVVYNNYYTFKYYNINAPTYPQIHLLGYGCDISIIYARPVIRVCVLKHPSSHTPGQPCKSISQHMQPKHPRADLRLKKIAGWCANYSIVYILQYFQLLTPVGFSFKLIYSFKYCLTL